MTRENLTEANDIVQHLSKLNNLKADLSKADKTRSRISIQVPNDPGPNSSFRAINILAGYADPVEIIDEILETINLDIAGLEKRLENL